jgi:hypothetical protein
MYVIRGSAAIREQGASPNAKREPQRSYQLSRKGESAIIAGINDRLYFSLVPVWTPYCKAEDGLMKGIDRPRSSFGRVALEAVGSEASSILKADPPQPKLRIWISGEEAVRGRQLVVVNFIGSSFDVNDDELALVFRPQVG